MADKFKTHGAFSWFELMTGDVDAARNFYVKLFGWKTEESPMEGGQPYTVIKIGDESVAGMMATPPQAEGTPPMWSIYITVEDIDAIAAKTLELGGKVLMPPTDIPKVGRFCVIQDPQGAVLCPIQYEEM